MKKFVSLLLCIFFVISLYTGCTNKENGTTNNTPIQSTQTEQTNNLVPDYLNSSGLPITNEKITVKVMGVRMPLNNEWEDMTLIKKISQLTNIDFVFDAVPRTGYIEKKNLAFASGDLPDIFLRGDLSIQDEETYGSQGMLIPLDELIQNYMPNFQKLINEDKNIKRLITSLDGSIYALPSIVWTTTMGGNMLWINQDWLEKVGMDVPTTVEEFYMVLKAFKENDPNGNGLNDEIPISVNIDNNLLDTTVLCAFGMRGKSFWVNEEGKVIFTPIEDNYKEYLKYLNTLYKENLLDNEMFTQTLQQMQAKGKEERVGVLTNTPSQMLPAKDNDMYVIMEPMISGYNSEKIAIHNMVGKYATIGGAFAITNKCKYPEAMARLVDFFYGDYTGEPDDISGLTLWLGEYGPDWEYKDDTKKEIIRKSRNENMTPAEYVYKFVTPMQGGNGAPGKIVTTSIFEGDYWQTVKGLEAPEKFFAYVKTNPISNFRIPKEDQTKKSMLENDIQTYVEMMYAKFITGEESFDNWDAYVTRLKQLGVEELREIYEKANSVWEEIN